MEYKSSDKHELKKKRENKSTGSRLSLSPCPQFKPIDTVRGREKAKEERGVKIVLEGARSEANK